MKKLLFLSLYLFGWCNLFAQNENPFAEYGYHVQVATMTNGRFPEFHDRLEVVEIGSVLLNTKSEKLVGDVVPDTTVMQLAPNTVSRFVTPDPLAERYYSISPYVYCANNPVRFVDPDGRVIVDATGKIITYSPDNGWSSNATVDVVRVGNAMLLTPSGGEMLNNLMNVSYPITITVNAGFSQNDPNDLGTSDIYTSKTSGEITKADITIYEGAIKEKVEGYKQMGEANSSSLTEKGKLLVQQQPTVNERMGQVGTHEGEHVTNPNAQSTVVGKSNAENQATKKEIQTIKETTIMYRPLESIPVKELRSH